MREDKASTRLFLCLFFVYTMNTFGKIAFPAVTAELVTESILTKTEAGTVSGIFWLIYAAGQFAGGGLATRMPPTLLIKIGCIGGAVTNLLLAGANSFWSIFIIWSANGILQFGVWPGILALMTSKIIPDQRNKSMRYISYCYGIGSILSYLCTAAVLSNLSWNYVFICCGIMNAISVLPVIYTERKLLPHLTDGNSLKSQRNKSKLPEGFIWKSGIVFFCMLIFIKSTLESGIKNWMPTILVESYNTTPEFTSILSVALLLLNLCGVSVCAYLYNKAKSNEVSSLMIIYSCIVPLIVSIMGYKGMNMYVTTVIFALITMLLYGSGQILSTYYPSRFQNIGGTAFLGGVINCFAALGNVVAAYANGLIADLFGWNMIIYLWTTLVVLFVVITIILVPVWKKFRQEN